MLRDDTRKPRLGLIVGGPIVALALIAIATLVVGSIEGAGIGTIIVGVIGLALAGASAAAAVTADRSTEDEPETRSEDVDRAIAHAAELAEIRLPALSRAVAAPGTTTVELKPFDVPADDETAAELIGSLNDIERSVHGMVETQEEAIREGIGQLVVNLVRRNQSLLDKQLEQIDELETSEEDPERLEQLYDLDLLATRMRRNAESLLVLAGAEPPRRRNGRVSVSDIARVAVSEIENYRQVEFRSLDEGIVVESAVVDLAHLLSEVLENATKFSPPDAPVGVVGRRADDGSYEIHITDSGIGIAEDKLGELNEILVDPPEIGLEMSRSLGLMVVGRLADRLGLKVSLSPNDEVGTSAVVHLPVGLLAEGEQGPADEAEIDGGAEAEADAIEELPIEPLAVRGRGEALSDDDSLFGPGRGPDTIGSSDLDDIVAEVPEATEIAAQDDAEIDGPAGGSDSTDEQAEDGVQSDALARLLGVAPGSSPATSTDKGAGGSSDTIDDIVPAADAPEPVADLDDRSAHPVETVSEAVAERQVDSLDEALPSGVVFDNGIESLLGTDGDGADAPVPTTGSGLAKRDRSKTYAPVGEGRTIPEAQSAPVAASSRKPEEIKQMLSRYRDARQRPSRERAAEEAAKKNSDQSADEQGESK